MTTQNEHEAGNGYLTALWAFGGFLAALGGIMWLANVPPESGYGETADPVWQAAGAGMLGVGFSFLALGLTAAAICHQIRQSARR